MIAKLIGALVESENEAADDLLLEALRLGAGPEKATALDALIRRETTRGLSGVIGLYDTLPQQLQLLVIEQIRTFYHALRESGRSADHTLRVAAMKLIALGRQGKLAYVLSENLHDTDEVLSKAATEAMVGLARWIATETHTLQRAEGKTDWNASAAYTAVMENRPEIEAAVARAMDVHRGKHGLELLRASLLLCDWPGSKTLAILLTNKHGGQSPMVRRLQQPPASEHVEAYLLGASHGGLRSHFGVVFSHIEEAPVLDALLRKTHWLKDHQLQLCMHQVGRGVWWGDSELMHDLERRPPEDAVKIGEWLAVSGMHDVMQDERMLRLRDHAKDDFTSRLRLLRIAAQRRRGASAQLIRGFLSDPDERLMRMAAREIIRRKPADFENLLLQLMTAAPDSVRRVVSRAIGQEGFEHFWERFDRMDRSTRRQAGRAMLKLLPDAPMRLSRRLTTGPVEQRVKALQVVQELGLGEAMRQSIIPLCSHPHAKVRSKAVALVGEVASVGPDVLLDKVLHDADPRVRANAIEVLETKRSAQYVPLLTQRARSSHSRERANAIKAMHRLKVSTASTQLLSMLRDERPDHRILSPVGPAADWLVAARHRGGTAGERGQQSARAPLRHWRAQGCGGGDGRFEGKSRMKTKGRGMRDEGRRCERSVLRAFLILPSALCLLPSIAFAAPTQEEVLRSINQSVGQEVDSTKLLAALFVIAALAILIALVSQRHKQTATPKTLNSPGKLIKEVCRVVNLKPAEIKQLRALAEAQELSNPLVLLLCPSLLAKAVKEDPTRVDRNLVTGLARKISLNQQPAE